MNASLSDGKKRPSHVLQKLCVCTQTCISLQQHCCRNPQLLSDSAFGVPTDELDVSDVDLAILTEGVHSKEAIELVKEHVLSVMGPAAMAFSSSKLKTSKLQMA